jgi:hypothetical protein
MLTPSNRCISVALCISSQLVASIRQEADPAAQSLRFHRALLAANKHKRSLIARNGAKAKSAV